ncbi:MAG: V-type ATPase subunit, partial [bacterium]|nr:V-type ATPase subunit [bacterium]
VKKAVRRLSQPERREHHLATEDYHLGPCGLVREIAWERVTSAAEVGRALEGTYLEEAFRRGLAVFGEQHDLLLFECGLEKSYLEELARRARRVAGPDGALLLPLVGNYVDEACVQAVVRLRFQHGLENAAVFPLLPLEGCMRMNEGIFWRLAGARSMDEWCRQLRGERGWCGVAGETYAGTIRALRMERQQLCRRAFVRATPLSLAPVVAFAFAHEQEVRDVITLLQAKRMKVPLEPGRCIRAEAA